MKHIKTITDMNICGTDHLSDEPPRIAVRAVLIDHDGMMALLFIGKYGFYTLPGGGVEEGESLTQALMREVKEEAGCECEILRELGYIKESRAKYNFTQISNYYLANVIGEKGELSLTQEETDEDTRVEWHTIHEALQLISSPVHDNYQRKYVQSRDIAVLEEAIQIIVSDHYDSLVDENNDPVHDPEPLREYMDKWDGQQFIDALQLSPEKDVLEIGVGTGRLAIKVAPLCRRFYGIDLSPKSVKRAEENLLDHKNITILCGNFLAYTFDRTFDVIYSSLTFMHINDKQTAIRKIDSLLAPGGLFVLSVSKRQDKVIDYGNRKIEVFPDSPEQIISLLADADLALVKQFETEFAVVFVASRKG